MIYRGKPLNNWNECLKIPNYYLSLSAADTTCDRTMDPGQNQYTVWAVGGLGETAFKHFIRAEGMLSLDVRIYL